MIGIQTDFPDHWNHSFGCVVKSRRHFRELQKRHGVHDWEEGAKPKPTFQRPEWRDDLWTTARLAREAGVKYQTAIDWREGRVVSSWAEDRIREAERREFVTSARSFK